MPEAAAARMKWLRQHIPTRDTVHQHRLLRPFAPHLSQAALWRMSGYAEEQLRNSIDIDHVNFLPKPFSVTELAEAARRTVSAK